MQYVAMDAKVTHSGGGASTIIKRLSPGRAIGLLVILASAVSALVLFLVLLRCQGMITPWSEGLGTNAGMGRFLSAQEDRQIEDLHRMHANDLTRIENLKLLLWLVPPLALAGVLLAIRRDTVRMDRNRITIARGWFTRKVPAAAATLMIEKPATQDAIQRSRPTWKAPAISMSVAIALVGLYLMHDGPHRGRAVWDYSFGGASHNSSVWEILWAPNPSEYDHEWRPFSEESEFWQVKLHAIVAVFALLLVLVLAPAIASYRDRRHRRDLRLFSLRLSSIALGRAKSIILVRGKDDRFGLKPPPPRRAPADPADAIAQAAQAAQHNPGTRR
jgi:hypothetical protein